MSQRTDERSPTRQELNVYNKILKLSDHTLHVCKPKDKNVNTKHIAKRHAVLAHKLEDLVVDIGSDILEANELYVGVNIDTETKIENYKARIELEEHARRMTFRMEHIIRTLHFDRPFADTTITYWVNLLFEARRSITKWKKSDKTALSKLEK